MFGRLEYPRVNTMCDSGLVRRGISDMIIRQRKSASHEKRCCRAKIKIAREKIKKQIEKETSVNKKILLKKELNKLLGTEPKKGDKSPPTKKGARRRGSDDDESSEKETDQETSEEECKHEETEVHKPNTAPKQRVTYMIPSLLHNIFRNKSAKSF